MKCLNKQDIQRIDKKVIASYQDALGIDHHRFLSWEHCYRHFSALIQKGSSNISDDELDLAALHLGFYLASWGMYRGSTFSLQRDYKIHTACVGVILNGDHFWLKDATVNDYLHDADKIKALFDLTQAVIKSYEPYKDKEQKVTDTLVTKILLGTLGCVPAYDRIFKNGLKRLRKPNKFIASSVNKFSSQFIAFLESSNEDEQSFLNLKKSLPKRDIGYPSMKIIDMYYWAYGLKVKNKKTKKYEDVFK